MELCDFFREIKAVVQSQHCTQGENENTNKQYRLQTTQSPVSKEISQQLTIVIIVNPVTLNLWSGATTAR